jgi:glutathione-specific gamma-glutamylcyclotransferase
MQQRWVFAYGSLMWNPGFSFAVRGVALLQGYHRSFCVLSYHYRGTPERPGLVLGLDRGGECRGVAYSVDAAQWETTHAYLTAREKISDAYDEMWLPVALADSGATVDALTYVVNTGHEQYTGKLGPEEAMHYINQGHGLAGPCTDYVRNTLTHLRDLKIRDDYLEAFAAHVPGAHAASR